MFRHVVFWSFPFRRREIDHIIHLFTTFWHKSKNQKTLFILFRHAGILWSWHHVLSTQTPESRLVPIWARLSRVLMLRFQYCSHWEPAALVSCWWCEGIFWSWRFWRFSNLECSGKHQGMWWHLLILGFVLPAWDYSQLKMTETRCPTFEKNARYYSKAKSL